MAYNCEQEIKRLQQQLADRDKEIKRLFTMMHDSDENYRKRTSEYRTIIAERDKELDKMYKMLDLMREVYPDVDDYISEANQALNSDKETA